MIITADDFGLSESVNEAVELAYRQGVLSAASLMVGAPATADAVRRARNLPGLRVGLHAVLTDGTPTLPARLVPDLVDTRGRFRDNMLDAGIRFFCSRRTRGQLAAEIRAQFEAFRATGLSMDHVNAHKHFHLHPTVLSLLLAIGSECGVRAIRVPHEALLASLRTDPDGPAARVAWALFLAPWTQLLKWRIRRAGWQANDAVIGLGSSGRMSEAVLLRALEHLPPGVVEIYLHPATGAGTQSGAPMDGYQHEAELAALVSPRVRKRLAQLGLRPSGFADITHNGKSGSTSGP